MKRRSKALAAGLVPLTLLAIVAACSSSSDPEIVDGPDAGADGRADGRPDTGQATDTKDARSDAPVIGDAGGDASDGSDSATSDAGDGGDGSAGDGGDVSDAGDAGDAAPTCLPELEPCNFQLDECCTGLVCRPLGFGHACRPP